MVLLVSHLLLLLLYPHWSLGQSSLAMDFSIPSNCTQMERFDPAQMRCVSCPDEQISSFDRISCNCPPTHRISRVVAGGFECQQCPEGDQGQGSLCLPCDGASCHCPVGEVWRVANFRGPPSNDSCISCQPGSFPTADGTNCIPCHTFQCVCENTPADCESSVPVPGLISTQIRLINGLSAYSRYLGLTMASTANRCGAGSEVDCEALTNLCVLQSFDREGTNACSLIEQIRRANINGQSALFGLFYPGDSDAELNRETAITQAYVMDPTNKRGRMQIIVSRYWPNGTLFDVVNASQTKLSLCGRDLMEALVFGRKYRDSCGTKLSSINTVEHRLFHEAFLQFEDDTGAPKMYPIPVVNRLIQSRSQMVNSLPRESNRWILTRRFYLMDDYSMQSENGSSSVIRYATDIELRIQMQPTRDGLIYPPYLIIDYSERSDVIDSTVLAAVFKVSYSIDPSRHDRDVEITMAVLAPTSIIWAGLSAYSWGRRSGKQLLSDASAAVQFILFSAAILGDVFFIIPSIIACWLTFTYKSQTYVFYNMIDSGQEWTIWIYLVVAGCLKLAGLIQRNIQMVTQETFFIDWERPKIVQETNTGRPMSRDVSKDRKEQPVVVWRTYLVANEWNELQNYRKTSVALQMLAMLFILDFLGWINYAAIESGFSRVTTSPSVESSMLSRLAVVVFTYLMIAWIQWTVQVLIVERLIQDPFHNFMDLCSISNISVLSLTHSLFGFYIHGRSVHGRADAGMAEMNDFLQRERDNLCGFRGLESSSELQTFFVALPGVFRKRYDEIMGAGIGALPQSRLTGLDHTTARMTATVRIHEQMNMFLQELVDHSLQDVDYVIRDRSFAESLLDMETNDTTQVGNFIRDPSEIAYSRCFVYGNEWIHMSFECVLFCITFLLWQSLPLSASIVFVVSFTQRSITSMCSTNHLVKSSLVDQRFLI